MLLLYTYTRRLQKELRTSLNELKPEEDVMFDASNELKSFPGKSNLQCLQY